jgi:hypothetical protein
LRIRLLSFAPRRRRKWWRTDCHPRLSRTSFNARTIKPRDGAAKLLNKALDHRHRVAINQFDKAKTEEEVRTLWREARQKGEIPGAYWAAMTHPATTKELIRMIFGEVHMLSHLVNSSM